MTNDEIFFVLIRRQDCDLTAIMFFVPSRRPARERKTFELSFGKMMIIAVVALIVLGPEKLPARRAHARAPAWSSA